MKSFTYFQIDPDAHEEIGDTFCLEKGDDSSGGIPEAEFDRLFDHLSVVLLKHGTFSEEASGQADFKGYRYVDQCPLIQTVVAENVPAIVVIDAALEAVCSAHRPLAASFDMDPNYLLVVAPETVYGTFPSSEIEKI